MKKYLFLFLLPLALFAQNAGGDRAGLLKGITYLYMNVDTSLAPSITNSERMDISDIVELQLRRANIPLRQYVVNDPGSSVPLLEVTVKDARARGGDSYEIILRMHDYVTVDRNKERTTAVIYEMTRDTLPATDDIDSLKIKLRELMGDFVAIFQKHNR